MHILADTNIVAEEVRALRTAGHDVVHVAERAAYPGDAALLAEAVAEVRVFVTKDHDVGILVRRDHRPHHGVRLIDDLGDVDAETVLISSRSADLAGRAFLRATEAGVSMPFVKHFAIRSCVFDVCATNSAATPR